MKAVFRLSDNGGEVHTADVAAQLGQAPGTVTLNVKRLAERDVLVHRPYKGVELTSLGCMAAASVIRRHRIVETFLTSFLGYDVDDAARLAITFEHQLPHEVEDRLFLALQSPETCPHGNVIPPPAASESGESIRLTDLTPGEAAVIALPDDLDTEVISLLETLGVKPGVLIELRENSQSDGPVVVRVNGEDRTVGEQLANRINVVPGVGTEADAETREVVI